MVLKRIHLLMPLLGMLLLAGTASARPAVPDRPSPSSLADRIDTRLDAHWKADKVTPAPLADDLEFLRRALARAGNRPREAAPDDRGRRPAPVRRPPDPRPGNRSAARAEVTLIDLGLAAVGVWPRGASAGTRGGVVEQLQLPRTQAGEALRGLKDLAGRLEALGAQPGGASMSSG